MQPKTPRSQNHTRIDGDATKALILESAGRLIAEHGYAATTSKMICEKAQTNAAAVNYHFGSRDGLYAAVLAAVHQNLLNIDFLNELTASPIAPRAKLERFIDNLVTAVYNDDNWYVRVWAREIVNPSPFIYPVLTKEAVPKFTALSQIFSDLTGIPLGDPTLYACMLGTMAPFIMVFLANRQLVGKVVPNIAMAPQELVQQLKKFVFAGLAAYIKS